MVNERDKRGSEDTQGRGQLIGDTSLAVRPGFRSGTARDNREERLCQPGPEVTLLKTANNLPDRPLFFYIT